jgi:antirestriction protein ArdC
MTSAFLCAECGIDNHVIHNQAAYMIGWAKAIRDDSRLIVVAAGQAQRAANYIQGIEREAPIPGRAEHLARSMEVRRLAHEIAESRRTKDAQKDMGIEISM